MKLFKIEPRLLHLLRETERPAILVNYRLVDSMVAGIGFNNVPVFVDVYVEEININTIEVEEVQVITIEASSSVTELCKVEV